MNYADWEQRVPEAMTVDSLWKMKAYRLALFLGDIGWHDVTKLSQDRRTVRVSGQLYEALGSMSANLAEGYSRGTGKDRARFYEYSLGSARESRDWYFKGRYVLNEKVINHRFQFLTEIIRLLLTMIPQQRGRILREETNLYKFDENQFSDDRETNLDDLFQNVPLPDS